MRAKITAIIDEKDRFGKSIVLVTFKGDDGKSYRLWTGKQFFNYCRWFSAISAFIGKNEVWCDGLILKGKNLIDADSRYTMEKFPKSEVVAESRL